MHQASCWQLKDKGTGFLLCPRHFQLFLKPRIHAKENCIYPAAPQFNERKTRKKIAPVRSKLRLISSSEHTKERNQSIYGNHGVGGDSREQHWIMTKKASLHLHYYIQGCNLLQSEVITMAVNGLHVETDSPRISHQLLCSNHHHHCILSSRSCKMLPAWKGCWTLGCVCLWILLRQAVL